MGDVGAGYLWRAISGIYDRADPSCIRPIPADDADEVLYVMPADGEDRPARAFEKATPAALG
ncbi:hypothetical protein GOL75_18535 [Sinorhizobium medicae]|nr:hypothetical protein [Sinorhizobium medicae]MDX0855949.1 hypothetical protein [Sinorhizobium medicae]MDX0905255.1 hypothetical protein [Sinorhizobium medicae]MDX1163317.1 hypothetical protein [Sinorhizobium medicae]MDX1210842.1 hypothetical protein [Sinorhizobium medicae]